MISDPDSINQPELLHIVRVTLSKSDCPSRNHDLQILLTQTMEPLYRSFQGFTTRSKAMGPECQSQLFHGA